METSCNNECEKYVETIYFQYDLFPVTDITLDYVIPENCKVKQVNYYLDSSMGDSVRVNLNYVDRLGAVRPILLNPILGNNHIRGTFNSTILEFKTNLRLKRADKIQIYANNLSASDVTIMALIDLEFNTEEMGR